MSARNAKIISLREGGMGPREIGRQLDLSPSTVAGVLFRAGLTASLPGRGRGNGATETFKRIVATTAGTYSQVAASFGVSRQAVWTWRREYGDAA